MNYTLIVVRHFFQRFIALLGHTFSAGFDIYRHDRLLGAPGSEAECSNNYEVCS